MNLSSGVITKVNIWILNHYATPPDAAGYTRHFDFAVELVKRGHQVRIFSSSFSHRTGQQRLAENNIYGTERVAGVEFVWVKTFAYEKNNWRRVANMLSYAVRVVPAGLVTSGSPDVILASSPHLFAGLSGYILSKIKKAKFILEIRDLWPQTFIDIGGYSNTSPLVRILKVMENFLYRKASKIISLLPRAFVYMNKLGIKKQKIICIPNGVDAQFFENNEASLPEDLHKLISKLKASGKILVGHIGSCGIANSVYTIIGAARLLQEKGYEKIHFLLVGDGPLKNEIIKTAKKLGLKNISFYQSIPKKEVTEILKAIDIGVTASPKSNLYRFGVSINKIFDYMICAKPIVSALDSPNDAVTESGCGITVPPESSEEMAKAMIRIYNMSENQRHEMGTKGYEYVNKYHSFPTLTDNLLEAIRD